MSDKDKACFDQMKELAERIKQEIGDYSLIEDVMYRTVTERFGSMTEGQVEAVMGKKGEGMEAGKEVQ